MSVATGMCRQLLNCIGSFWNASVASGNPFGVVGSLWIVSVISELVAHCTGKAPQGIAYLAILAIHKQKKYTKDET